MIHVVMYICVQAVVKNPPISENQKKASTLAIKQVHQFKQEFIILSIWESIKCSIWPAQMHCSEFPFDG